MAFHFKVVLLVVVITFGVFVTVAFEGQGDLSSGFVESDVPPARQPQPRAVPSVQENQPQVEATQTAAEETKAQGATGPEVGQPRPEK